MFWIGLQNVFELNDLSLEFAAGLEIFRILEMLRFGYLVRFLAPADSENKCQYQYAKG